MSNANLLMQRCLDISGLGKGRVAPNPMVGSVLFHEPTQKIVSEGYHRFFGGPHAEQVAINNVEDKTLLKDCTLFVNMEPCSHHGKTPPCADLIIESGIPKVVIAASDPNPIVGGKGIEKLRNAGIIVELGLLEKAARFHNRAFYIFHENSRPYYILKWAESLNGKMGKTYYKLNESKNVSGLLSWKLSHQWRAESQGILVGVNTVITDNPLLNPRLYPGGNPIIIVLDPNLRTPENAGIFSVGSEVVIINSLKEETLGNRIYRRISFDKNWADDLNKILFDMSIQSVLVEGGPFTLNKFIQKGLWDEARIFQSEKILNWDLNAPEIQGLLLNKQRVGDDIFIQTINDQSH